MGGEATCVQFLVALALGSIRLSHVFSGVILILLLRYRRYFVGSKKGRES